MRHEAKGNSLLLMLSTISLKSSIVRKEKQSCEEQEKHYSKL